MKGQILHIDQSVQGIARTLETEMRERLSVEDCVVCSRKNEDSRHELVAYFVADEILSSKVLSDFVNNEVLNEWPRPVFVQVSNLPLTDDGQLDRTILHAIPIPDDDLVDRWQRKLKTTFKTEHVNVSLEQAQPGDASIHVDDILPCSNFAGDSIPIPTMPEHPFQQAIPTINSRMAICHGPPFHSPPGRSTLQDILKWTAVHNPLKGIIYVHRDQTATEETYSSVMVQAQRILGGLKGSGVAPGGHVIILSDDIPHFIVAFWACLLGGFIAVPIDPAVLSRHSSTGGGPVPQFMKKCKSARIICSEYLLSSIKSTFKGSCPLTIGSLLNGTPWHGTYVGNPDETCVKLLTSGTTGDPKMVPLSHTNILASACGAANLCGISQASVTLNWLPLTHIGGLVRSVRDVVFGCTQIQVATDTILKRPLFWLDLISQFAVDSTWSPNFGFDLVVDQIAYAHEPHWNLSSLNSIVSSGEMIVPETVRRFYKHLKPYGLKEAALHATWGMTEACSATCSLACLSDLSTNKQVYANVGRPVTGLSVRIVDDQGNVVSENMGGQIEIRGVLCIQQSEENTSSKEHHFTTEGWFRTGDLGFLHMGSLRITGREKDMIVTNGSNYSCQKIESVIAEVDGVDASCVTASAVKCPKRHTDELAVFFSTSSPFDDRLLKDLLRNIRARVAHRVGLTPRYLVPIEKYDLPKSLIGKTQRNRLRQKFENGEFSGALRRVDLLAGNENVIPDWFYTKTWKRKRVSTHDMAEPKEAWLVFSDDSVMKKLGNGEALHILVESGSDFEFVKPRHYRINARQPRNYVQLVNALSDHGICVTTILHMWTYGRDDPISLPKDLEHAQSFGLFSVLYLVQALSKADNFPSKLSLYVVSSMAQAVTSASGVACWKSTVLGLIKTLQKELKWLSTYHIDLPGGPDDTSLNHLVSEVQAKTSDREVAYRDGERFIPRLTRIHLKHLQEPIPFKSNGMYLITGGLGPIGVEISRFLLEHFSVRLVIIGRSKLPVDEPSCDQSEQGSEAARRMGVLEDLGQFSGEVVYESMDVCNLSGLRNIIERYKSQWNCDLAGIIHLAHVPRECLLLDETREGIESVLRPKVLGTWILHQLALEQGNPIFISFSSGVAYLGAVAMGAYAAANHFLDCFCYYQQYTSRIKSYCLASGIWRDAGLGNDGDSKTTRRTQIRGMMTKQQAIASFVMCMRGLPGYVSFGLNGTNVSLKRYIDECHAIKSISATLPREVCRSLTSLESCDVKDRFQVPSACNFVPVSDDEFLSNVGDVISNSDFHRPDVSGTHENAESFLKSAWSDLLGTEDIHRHDDFFALGGSSLLAMELAAIIDSEFDIAFSLRNFLQTPTVQSLATAILQHVHGAHKEIKLDSGSEL